jgi:hypothetical protein
MSDQTVDSAIDLALGQAPHVERVPARRRLASVADAMRL